LLYSLLAPVCWGVWGVVSKALDGLSAGQQQALSTLGIVPIMLALRASPAWREGRRKQRGLLFALVAGALVAVGNMAYYHALAAGAKAATAVSLTALYPVATIALARFFLKEKPSRVQLAGIGGSLAAIWLLNLGQAEGLLSGSMTLALAPIVLWGSAALVQKLATDDISAELGTFWFLAAFVPLGALLLGAEGVPSTISSRDWWLVGLLGASYGLGNLALLAAYRHGGKASIVTPVTGLYPVVAIPLAVLWFGEHVNAYQLAGIVLALVSVVALSFERKP
jgi:drug/metabolite transporter (DMT)-like permease